MVQLKQCLDSFSLDISGPHSYMLCQLNWHDISSSDFGDTSNKQYT